MANFTGAASGALGGAATGASLGSVIPGIGTAIGAGVGGLFGGIAGLFGNRKKKKKISTFDKRQKQLNEQQHQAVLGQGPLADLYNYDPEAANAVFDQTVSRKAYRDLKEQAIPGVTGQFRSQGLMNSSYAGDAISKLTRDVQENLDAERTRFQYGQQSDARSAKRAAIDNLQNRTTFDYDIGEKPFNISSILNSITPEMKKEFKDYFSKQSTPTTRGIQ
jgi:hypothetical protein